MSLGCLFLLAAFTAQVSACGRRSSGDDQPSTGQGSGSSSSGTIINACCQCGQPISLSLVVSNQIQEPFFEYRSEIKGIRQRELLHHLEEASLKSVNFRFSSEHFGSLGYMITKINGLAASTENKTYWHISSLPIGLTEFQSLPLGMSFYIPADNEIVSFNFTSYESSNH